MQSQLIRAVSGLVYPRVCVDCRGLVEDDGPWSHLCAGCAQLIHRVDGPVCTTCGHPYFGESAVNRECVHCAGLQPAFGQGRTAVLFKGAARALLLELKYHQGMHAMDDIAELLRRAGPVLEFVRGAVLVPVPLHPRKRRERGYNQSALIAHAMAEAAGGGTRVEEPLRRVQDTASQTAFDRKARLENLKNAFALAPGASLNPDLRHILVDDVFTTGSTLNACARILRRHGVLNPDVVTFGHG